MIDDLIELEISLSLATPLKSDFYDTEKIHNVLSMDEINGSLPEIYMSHIIQTFSDFRAETVIAHSPAYLEALSTVLQKTSARTIQTHLYWKAIQVYAPYVQDPYVEPLRALENKLNGRQADAMPERWRTCVSEVDSGLGMSNGE